MFSVNCRSTSNALANALEQSVQRAESLDMRGFGRLAHRRQPWEPAVAAGSLIAAAWGSFLFYDRSYRDLGLVLMLGGSLAVAIILWLSGRGEGPVRLETLRLSPADGAMLVASVAALGVFLAARITDSGGVTYLPFPALHAPPFAPLAVFALLLLAAPAFIPSAGGRVR